MARPLRTRLQHVALAPWVRAMLDTRPVTVAALVERDTTRRTARPGGAPVLARHKLADVRGALRHLVATGEATHVRGGWRLAPEPHQPPLLEE